MDDQRIPQNDDDFEKMILSNPNDSCVWIKYVAFKMEKEGNFKRFFKILRY